MESPNYRSLKKWILGTMILVPLIPFTVVLMIGYYHFAAYSQEKTVSELRKVAKNHREMIQSFLDERESDLRFISQMSDFSKLSQSSYLKTVFKNLKSKSPAFVDLGVFDKQGMHVAYEGPYELTGKNYKEAVWFKEVMERGYYVSDIFLGYRKIPHFVIAVAQDDGDKWVLRATIDTLMFTELVEKIRIGKTGEAYILNKKGEFQTERRSGGDLLQPDSEAKGFMKTHKGVNTFYRDNKQGESCIYATAWLNNGNWLLVVRQEKADAFKALSAATYLAVIILVLGGIAIVIAAFHLTNRIVKRMENLADDKEKLNQQLFFAARLAQLGEMSAGFAHEINNPLQVILAQKKLIDISLEEMREKGEVKEGESLDELEESVEQIYTQVGRCSEITQAILNFAPKKGSWWCPEWTCTNLSPIF